MAKAKLLNVVMRDSGREALKKGKVKPKRKGASVDANIDGSFDAYTKATVKQDTERFYKTTYSPKNLKEATTRVGGVATDETGFTSRLSGQGKWAMGNIRSSLRSDRKTFFQAAAGDALRGSITGGVTGGLYAEAQGGSFWAGAKEGAFNGAVGWSGYKMGMRATGATSRNPFAGLGKKSQNDPNAKRGVLSSAGNMVNLSSSSPEISRQAAALINQKQWSGLSNAVVKNKGNNIF